MNALVEAEELDEADVDTDALVLAEELVDADVDADTLALTETEAEGLGDGDHVPAFSRSQNGPTLNVARCVPAIE